MGVASKDGSKTKIREVEFIGVDIPFASYVKKQSYKPAYLDIKNISKITTFKVMGLKDENSKIVINGKSEGNRDKEILNVIYKRLPIKKDDRRI